MQMQISFNKCQSLTQNGSANGKGYVFYLFGNKIPVVQFVKNLGLIIDNKLTFNDHCLKTNPFDKLYLQIFKMRNVDFLIRLKCYVLPLLDYCCQLVVFSHYVKIYQTHWSIQRLLTRLLYDTRLPQKL